MFFLPRYFLTIVIFCAIQQGVAAQCPVIPQPVQATKQASQFLLNPQTAMVVKNELLQAGASYLQQKILQQHHIAVSRQTAAAKNAIHWQLSTDKKMPVEGYSIRMRNEEIIVSANDAKGAFNAAISLLQLAANAKKRDAVLIIDCWNITDAPLYSWRGFMLDESRYFFGKAKVKSLLDWMAFYKLNRFHWHLTDEPGWRLEIKQYPLLHLVGGVGNYATPFAPATYYTQEDIHEIIRYASERQIVVIPEIDMPGHATAANKAYPQFSGGGSAKHPDFTFHPAKPETYSYLSNILRETNALFPSGMLHLGGDEVSFGNEKWAADPLVQKLMKEQKLANINAVEQYFMKRMADSVFAMNAKLLAWDEVAEADLPADKTILFWWRHDLPAQLQKALSKGYNVVLCPRLPFYFDFVQDSTHTEGRRSNKGLNSLENVYSFSTKTFPFITTGSQQQVLGIQANLWTETMPSEQRVDYMLFPRIAALAEAAWTSIKDYPGFKERLVKHLSLYKQAGIQFYNPF
jgi:hexosaminidase